MASLMTVVCRRLVEAEYLPATRINYERWMRRYVRYIAPVHPRQAGQAGVAKYITHLAVERNLSASSQNQALDALVFLYDCLEIPIDTRGLRAKTGRRLQATASPGEILLVIEALPARGWPGNVAGYVFPSSRIAGGRCWHVSPSSLQKALGSAQRGSARRITPRVLRHSFVAGLLGFDKRFRWMLRQWADQLMLLLFLKGMDLFG